MYKKAFFLSASIFCFYLLRPEDQFEYLLSALKGNAETSLREAVMADHVPAMKTEVESTPPDAVVVESLVSKVKDLLPHLGAGFIKVRLLSQGNG